jgi:hypothetical protein
MQNSNLVTLSNYELLDIKGGFLGRNPLLTLGQLFIDSYNIGYNYVDNYYKNKK